MKNGCLIIALLLTMLILFSAVYKYFFSKPISPELEEMISRQQNPFVVHKDSAAVVWQRAATFFEERKGIISGGQLQQNDSMFFLPYYNDYHKGSSVRILKRAKGDSVEIEAWWWYNGDTTNSGANEIALYLQTGIGRYNFGK